MDSALQISVAPDAQTVIDHIVVGYVSSDIPLSLSLSLVYLKETMPDIMLWKQAIKYLTLAT